MNIFRKQKAMKLVATETDREKMVDLLTAEQFTNEEILEVIEELEKNPPGSNSGPTAPEKAKAAGPSSPNEKIDLSGIDYKQLKGKVFHKYVSLVGDRNYVHYDSEERTESVVTPLLKQEDMFDFELYKAEPIRVDRFPGIKDSPKDFIGIRILNQHSLTRHGKYYLLKKVS